MSARWQRKYVPLLLLPLVVLGLSLGGCTGTKPPQGPADSYLFCFWNVENLFDDKDDGRKGPGDKTYDPWFAEDSEARKLKYEHLSEAIVKMNDGRGPDILAVAEVETERAAELLRDALNAKLKDEALHYTHILMKEPSGGRHIATAILTRLPVESSHTLLLNKRLRILEGHLTVNGHDLVIIASHWTSRVSEAEDEEGKGRDKYGDQIYGRFKGMYMSNPKVDLLVCGDFNDPPNAESVVEHLHAIGDRGKVLSSTREQPHLLNLFAGKDPAHFGTLFHDGEWSIYDQIAISPGLLDDEGWKCETDTAATISSLVDPADEHAHPKPWRFGGKHDKHGYSDHFPVTVRLKVQGN